MKVLLAVDGSAYTTKAVNFVLSHFNWFKESPELHVLHVKLPIPIPEGRAAAVVGRDAVENYYKVEAEQALAPAEKLLRKNNIPFKGGYCIGEIDQQIDAYAKEHQIDLIVMGSHGHGALKNLVMGSVATKVVARSSVPVLLIR